MELTGTKTWWPLGDLEQMRDAVRYWIANNWQLDLTVAEWWRRLAEAGLTVPTWQRTQGGLNASSNVQNIIERELAAAGTVAPPVSCAGVRVVGPTLRQFAQVAQAVRWLPPIVRGETAWVVLSAEPDRPDVGDTQCRLDMLRGLHTLTGTKVMPVDAGSPTHALVVARTADLPGRKGLSCVVVPLRFPGVTVTDGGTVTFDDVTLIPDDMLANPNQGWAVMKVVLSYVERSLSGRIRRGMVHVEPGTAAGNLERVVGEVISSAPAPTQSPADRRHR